jgi:SPOR domain
MPQAHAPQWANDPRMGEPSLDFGHYGAQGGTGQQQQPVARRPAAAEQQAYQQQQPQHQQQPPANQAYAEEEEYEEEFVEEEPRRGRRGLLVVAALVGAIGLGGSMAYVYKTYGKSFASGKPPVVKAETQPTKTKPAAPGGKEFPNADRKIFGRLGEDAAQGTQTAAAAPTADTQADGGPRKVQTIAIPPPSAAGPTVSVPGMSVENVGPPPGARGLPPIIPQQQPAPVAQKAAPKVAPPPVVVAAAPPAAATVAAAEIVPAPRKPAPRPKANDALTSPAAPAGAVATAAVAAPPPAAAQPAAATGANGFVAVLSSQKSRLDALKVYADIQQKFGQVLSNKPADVQEANLGDKGVYYRAVVGPPGSRDAASTLCGQLKAAGFAGCWVTAY